MEYIVLWVVVSAAALVLDIVTTSFFFSGFTVGGIAAIIAQMIGASFLVQFIVFAFVSAAAIALEYLWVRKRLKGTIPKTLRMEEEYIGRKITVEDDIIDRGKLKIDGIYWTVENAGEAVNKGDTVEIIGIKGNKLIIKK